MKLIDNAGREFHRLWTIRIALFFGVLNGVALGLAAFVDTLNPFLFMGLNVLVYGGLVVARLTKQADPPAANAPTGSAA